MEKEIVLEQKTKKDLVLKIAKIAGNVVFYVVIACLLLFSIMNIRGTKDNSSYPNLFGRGMLVVLTDSMDGDKEDSFKEMDLLIVKTFKAKNADELEVGDVVTFYDQTINNGDGGLNTHRIVFIHKEGENITSIVTQGDKSVKVNGWTFNPLDTSEKGQINNQNLISDDCVEFLSVDDVLGVMVKVKEGAGATLVTIQDNWFVIFVIPVLLFLIVEIFIVVKNVLDLKNEKQKEELQKSNDELKAEMEAQKEALRAEILAELKKEQEKETE